VSVSESTSPLYWLTHTMLLDFSNILTKSAIERLAQVDEYEVVREVQVGLLPSFDYICLDF
jgi:hypothetical protein